jgi:hypothetical protein
LTPKYTTIKLLVLQANFEEADMMVTKIAVVLESGQKRVFASALDWPGWARSGQSESAALEELWVYRLRFQRVLSTASIEFQTPDGQESFKVVQRLTGNATTDFGAPGKAALVETRPIDQLDLSRLSTILTAVWQYFAVLVDSTHGKNLRLGPRGGGRDLEKITAHVLDSHIGYLHQLGWRQPFTDNADVSTLLKQLIRVDAQALAFATSATAPRFGPRGGALWSPRYFIRRAAWHILDHAWEIEDRLESL